MTQPDNPMSTEPEWLQKLRALAIAENNVWLTAETAEALRIWLARFAYYDEREEAQFKDLKQWRNDRKVKSAALNLLKALAVLKDMYESTRKPVSYNEMRAATLEIIQLKLIRFEIVQFKLLERAQKVKRYYEWPFKSSPQMNANDIWHTPEDPKTPHSIKETKLKLYAWHTQMKEYKHYKDYIKEANEAGLKSTSRLFKRYKRGVYFKDEITQADQATRVFFLINAINNALSTIAKFSEAVMHFLAPIGIFLTAIPIIGAVVSAVPLVITAVDAWLNNRSPITKSTAVVGLAVVAGGLVATGFGTLAAAIAGVGLLIVGSVQQRLLPFLKLSKEDYLKRKELVEVRDICDQFKQTNKLDKLGWREKNFLLVALEQQWLKKDADHAALSTMRNRILEADSLDTLAKIDGLPRIIGKNLNSFLLEKMKQRVKDLNHEINEIQYEKGIATIKVTNSNLAILGAALACIPTPVTWALGASLILATAIVGVVVEFKLVEKIFAAIARRQEKSHLTAKIKPLETAHTPTPRPLNAPIPEIAKAPISNLKATTAKSDKVTNGETDTSPRPNRSR